MSSFKLNSEFQLTKTTKDEDRNEDHWPRLEPRPRKRTERIERRFKIGYQRKACFPLCFGLITSPKWSISLLFLLLRMVSIAVSLICRNFVVLCGKMPQGYSGCRRRRIILCGSAPPNPVRCPVMNRRYALMVTFLLCLFAKQLLNLWVCLLSLYRVRTGPGKPGNKVLEFCCGIFQNWKVSSLMSAGKSKF